MEERKIKGKKTLCESILIIFNELILQNEEIINFVNQKGEYPFFIEDYTLRIKGLKEISELWKKGVTFDFLIRYEIPLHFFYYFIQKFAKKSNNRGQFFVKIMKKLKLKEEHLYSKKVFNPKIIKGCFLITDKEKFPFIEFLNQSINYRIFYDDLFRLKWDVNDYRSLGINFNYIIQGKYENSFNSKELAILIEHIGLNSEELKEFGIPNILISQKEEFID